MLDADVAESLAEYVRTRGQRLLRTAFVLTGDRQLAEDLVQNALASVMVSWRHLAEVADLDAYLYRCLVHASSRWWRRRWHGEVPSERLPEAATGDETPGWDRRADVLAALGRLPARQRATLVLRFYEDLTEARTAEVLGCSVGTVKSQTSRGLAALRQALDGHEGSCPTAEPGRRVSLP